MESSRQESSGDHFQVPPPAHGVQGGSSPVRSTRGRYVRVKRGYATGRETRGRLSRRVRESGRARGGTNKEEDVDGRWCVEDVPYVKFVQENDFAAYFMDRRVKSYVNSIL